MNTMSDPLITFLSQRPETGALLSPVDIPRVVGDLFPDYQRVLPRPYKIFFADESVPPILGFPVKDSAVLQELETRLSTWLNAEVAWQLTRDSSKKVVDQALGAYLAHLARVTENAMLSNLLADYHAIFWLAHSLQLSRHFSNVKRTMASVDTEAGRNKADMLRYRALARWSVEVKGQMTQLTSRMTSMLEGEEARGLQFFLLLQENVLILTEEYISPDLRELRSFLTGFLNQNYFAFREKFERMRATAVQLRDTDRVFRNTLELFSGRGGQEITTGLLLDSRFQTYMFNHPSLDQQLSREEKDLIQSISRRIGQFAVLHQLRRGISWMTSESSGEIVSTDRRQEIRYAKTTRPIDFGHSGVVDPMVYRFGLMYDITSFSETLGNIAKGGLKGELGSYRQMLLFQRRLDGIADRHQLQLEKFLGDGAFYTTRRVLPLLRAGVEIQRYYSELRKKGFAFNRGLRIALNYGYYRLLPMRGSPNSTERTMEFYGPGVVELSRLTTGKVTKEIEEIEGFLISHGYNLSKVQQFFAPLTGVTSISDRKMQAREFHAFVDANGHMVNEGIVASFSLLQELSAELTAESHQLYRILTPWASYIGFPPEIDQISFIGVRLIGTASFKGLEKMEVGEVVAFAPGEGEATPLEDHSALLNMVRHEYHNPPELPAPPRVGVSVSTPARETSAVFELVLCSTVKNPDDEQAIIIGEWDPHTDEIRQAVRIAGPDLEQLLGTEGPLTREKLQDHRKLLQQIYHKLRATSELPTLRLSALRRESDYVTFPLSDRIQKGEAR